MITRLNSYWMKAGAITWNYVLYDWLQLDHGYMKASCNLYIWSGNRGRKPTLLVIGLWSYFRERRSLLLLDISSNSRDRNRNPNTLHTGNWFTLAYSQADDTNILHPRTVVYEMNTNITITVLVYFLKDTPSTQTWKCSTNKKNW